MHKNFRNSNKVHPVTEYIKNNILPLYSEMDLVLPDPSLPVLERPMVLDAIEARVDLVAKHYPLKRDLIKKRILKYIKQNRVAMRYEASCLRYIKQFSVEVFMICETCSTRQKYLNWDRCSVCGAFNMYK